MTEAENIVLTGFMGTGKSTVGQLLADELHFEWIDTDALIESRYGSIAEMFAANGEEAFRDIESAVAAELAASSGLVISSGGRMMLDPANAALFRDRARVFCLTATAAEVLRRVAAQGGSPRPLLAGDHPADRIAALLEERAFAYGQFEQIATDGMSPEEVVHELLRRLAT